MRRGLLQETEAAFFIRVIFFVKKRTNTTKPICYFSSFVFNYI